MKEDCYWESRATMRVGKEIIWTAMKVIQATFRAA